jgi:hypothetical protein
MITNVMLPANFVIVSETRSEKLAQASSLARRSCILCMFRLKTDVRPGGSGEGWVKSEFGMKQLSFWLHRQRAASSNASTRNRTLAAVPLFRTFKAEQAALDQPLATLTRG